MKRYKFLIFVSFVLGLFAFGANQSMAYVPPPQLVPGVNYMLPNYANSPVLTKFKDSLPGLTAAGANSLGNYIPVATPMGTATPAGVPQDGDYYEIALVEFSQQMHSDMPATKLRGYVQIEPPGSATPAGSLHKQLFYPDGVTPITVNGQNVYGYDKPLYLGPIIQSTKGTPTRIKFYNLLPTTANGGDLFIPTDVTVMGAGMGPDGSSYTQNRSVIHLHGGDNPWISDGTTHQWITPAGEAGTLLKGASQQNVPDMPAPGPGAATFYWPNEQSGRLMFYHEHAYGITRLGVYAGVVAGYLLKDPAGTGERTLNSLAPGGEVPLIIQDKAFVSDGTLPAGFPAGAVAPSATTAVDPLWASGPWGQTKGSLWFPHVYMPNQNPNDLSGASMFGRWDYGAWFWPIFPSGIPPQTSIVPETFVDTPVINGTAYPFLNVNPTTYRFRILNGCNDRYLNLQFYVASPIISGIKVNTSGSNYSGPVITITDPSLTAKGATAAAIVGNGLIGSISVTTPGLGYTAPVVNITDPTGTGATASAAIDANGSITGITVTAPGSGYTAPVVNIADTPPGTGTGATASAAILPGPITGITLLTVGSGYTAPVVNISDPTGTGATATATLYTALTEVGMVPASKTAGIAFPAWWQANDTPGMTPNILDGRDGGVPDPAKIGPSFIHIGSEGGISPQAVVLQNTPIGYEQNKRSVTVLNTYEHTLFLGPAERADVMVDFSQFANKTLIMYNDAPAPLPAGDPRNDYYTANPDNTFQGGAPSTQAGFGPNTRTIMQIKVAAGTGTPVNVAALNTAVAGIFNTTQAKPIVPANTYARISDTSMTATFNINGVPTSTTLPLQPKTIQELFDPLGRMNATLGVELPFTTATIQTTIPYGFADPATEVIPDGETQLWKITHNGVDTHAIHFHLFNVQVINRVGWDGMIKPPWPEELGWKETVKMNPLEDIVVALRAKVPTVPFVQPNNVRYLDPTLPPNAPISVIADPNNNPVTGVTNWMANFGNEYTWHCHLLGHEENDMMRPIMVAVAPLPPSNLSYTVSKGNAVLTWQDNSPDETAYMVQKKTGTGPWTTLATVPAGTLTYTDTTYKPNQGTVYQVFAVNTAGSGVASFPSVTMYSIPSNQAAAPLGATTITSLAQAVAVGSPVVVKWAYSATDQTGFTIQRSTSNTFPANSTAIFTVAGNIFTYSDTSVVVGLKKSTTYYYRVIPTNANGSGAPSNTASLLVHP